MEEGVGRKASEKSNRPIWFVGSDDNTIQVLTNANNY
jgi:hypothetical protein